MFQWHNKSMLEILLASDSLQCFFTTVRFMKIVSDADEQALEELESASEEAETMRLRSENSYNELTVLAEEAEEVLQEIKADQDMTQSELDEAAYSLSLYRQKEQDLSSKTQDAKADVDRYAVQYEYENRPTTTTTTRPQTTTAKQTQAPATNAPTQPANNGSFAWPVPSSSYISYYGWRNIFGGSSWHAGIDIAAEWVLTLLQLVVVEFLYRLVRYLWQSDYCRPRRWFHFALRPSQRLQLFLWPECF